MTQRQQPLLQFARQLETAQSFNKNCDIPIKMVTYYSTIETPQDLADYRKTVSESTCVNELLEILESYNLHDAFDCYCGHYYQMHRSEICSGLDCVCNTTTKTAISIALSKYISINLNISLQPCFEVDCLDFGILNQPLERKLEFLLGLLDSKKIRVGSSFFSRGALIRCFYDNQVFYLVSMVTPIDAVFYPGENMAVISRKFSPYKLDIFDLIGTHVSDYCTNTSAFVDALCSKSTVASCIQVVKVNRPYHVFSDEMYANYVFNESLKVTIPIVYTSEASFFENETVLEAGALNNIGLRNLLFCSQQRLDYESDCGWRFIDSVLNKANDIYEKFTVFIKSVFADRKVIWITITGGEKPRLKNENDFLYSIIRLFEESCENCFYVFDGYTGSECPNAKSDALIDVHNRVVSKFVSDFSLSGRYISIVGKRLYIKFFFSQFANVVFSSGSPLVWSANGNPEVVVVAHGGSVMLEKISEFTRANKVLLLADAYKSWEDQSMGLRADRVSYELDLSKVIDSIGDIIKDKI